MKSLGAVAAILSITVMVTGCDYWRNLVGEKGVTHSTLKISVIDAWTGQPLPDAGCQDTTLDAAPLPTDNAGNLQVTDMPTGHYRFTCRHEGYFDSELSFDQGAAQVNRVASLARHGGPDWYPNESDKQVGFIIDGGNTLVPAELVLHALPDDSSGALRFVWIFAHHPELNREMGSVSATKPVFKARLAAIPVDSVEDTVTLKVMARLGGKPDYEINSVKMPITWIRNRVPNLVVTSNRTQAKAGCPDDDDFAFNDSASDPDGTCLWVKVVNLDPTTSFGAINSTQSCEARTFSIPLSTASMGHVPSGMDPQVFGTNRLKISAVDDNHQSHDTIIIFKTSPHAPPKITLNKVAPQTANFVNDAVLFRITASDSEAHLTRLLVNWQDNSPDTLDVDLSFPQIPLIEKNYPHRFSKPGNYYPTASIINACGTKVTATFSEGNYIHIQSDNAPTVIVSDQKRSLKNGKPYLDLMIAADDKDLILKQDSLDVTVSWGDGVDSIYVTGESFRRQVEHGFASTPPDSIYPIKVTVADRHGGSADTSFTSRP